MNDDGFDIASLLADVANDNQSELSSSSKSPRSGRATRIRPLKPLKVGSCTACRRGKLKCDRGGTTNSTNINAETPYTCSRCQSHGLKCEYEVHKTGYKVAPVGKLTPGVLPSQDLGKDLDLISKNNGIASSFEVQESFEPSAGSSACKVPTFPFVLQQPGELRHLQGSDVAPPGIGNQHQRCDRQIIREVRLDVLPDENPIIQGILSVQEAAALFLFYYGHLHTWNAILDIRLHTLDYVQERSTFLLCVILTQAAAHHGLSFYFSSALASHTRALCGKVFSQGYRSPELVAAYMLYSTWLPPDATVQENNSWSLVGMAIRMAEEIGLGSRDTIRPVASKASTAHHVDFRRRQMEQRFAGRTWLQLLVVDRNMSSQMGRPCMMSSITPLAEGVRTFMQEPGSALPERLLGASFIRRSVAHALPDGVTSRTSMKELSLYRLARLDRWKEEFYRHHDGYGKSCYHHDRMLILSSLQDASTPFADGKQRILDEAVEILNIWLDNIVACNSLQYATNLGASLVAYAAATILEILRENQSRFSTHEKQSKVELVRQLADDMLQVGPIGLSHGYVAYYGRALKDLLGHDDSPTEVPTVSQSFEQQPATQVPFQRDFAFDFEELQKYCFPGWTPALEPFLTHSAENVGQEQLHSSSLSNWFNDLDTVYN